jgi:hypothetical protein
MAPTVILRGKRVTTGFDSFHIRIRPGINYYAPKHHALFWVASDLLFDI